MTVHKACTWLFDLDGTLVDSISGQIPRPYVCELMGHLREHGVEVLVWSAGGAGYVRRRAEKAGFVNLIDRTFTKAARSSDGSWELPLELCDVPPCVLIDDQPEELPRVGEVVGVRPFIGANPRDRALADLCLCIPSHHH